MKKVLIAFALLASLGACKKTEVVNNTTVVEVPESETVVVNAS